MLLEQGFEPDQIAGAAEQVSSLLGQNLSKYAQAQAEHAMKTMELNAKRIQDMGLNESDAKMVSSLSRALPSPAATYP